MQPQVARICALIISTIALQGAMACKSTKRLESLPPVTEDVREIRGLIPSTLRIVHTESRLFECDSVSELYREMNLDKLRECLSEHMVGSARYKLVREASPYWLLLDQPDTPDCVKARLRRIPVPREIYFQSQSDGALACYRVKLASVSSTVLGVPNPFRGDEVMVVELPLDELIKKVSDVRFETAIRVTSTDFPESQDRAAELFTKSTETEAHDLKWALLRALVAWSLTPLQQQGKFRANPAPDARCLACMSDRIMIQGEDAQVAHPHWPAK